MADEGTHRWNIEPKPDGTLRVCRGLHDKATGCEWETFVPAERLRTAEAERDRLQAECSNLEEDIATGNQGYGGDAEKLAGLLRQRDDFIVSRDLWSEFVASLPRASMKDARALARETVSEIAHLRSLLAEVKYFWDEDFPDGPDGPCAVTDRYRKAYRKVCAALEDER